MNSLVITNPELIKLIQTKILNEINNTVITNNEINLFFKENAHIDPNDFILNCINNNKKHDLVVCNNKASIDINDLKTLYIEYNSFLKDAEEIININKTLTYKINNLKFKFFEDFLSQFIENENQVKFNCDICNLNFKSYKGLSIHKRKCLFNKEKMDKRIKSIKTETNTFLLSERINENKNIHSCFNIDGNDHQLK
jgi:hypothetical protein